MLNFFLWRFCFCAFLSSQQGEFKNTTYDRANTPAVKKFHVKKESQERLLAAALSLSADGMLGVEVEVAYTAAALIIDCLS
jgi:hypothetical protein